MKHFSKKAAVLGLVGLGMVAHISIANAAATPQSCTQVVSMMKKEWKAVDFATPSKPTAVRVEGKYGHENTAAQIAYMQDQMKKADADCKAGNQQSALQRVSSIHDLLDSHGISQETANAAMAQQ
jgi:hypothetical protein